MFFEHTRSSFILLCCAHAEPATSLCVLGFLDDRWQPEPSTTLVDHNLVEGFVLWREVGVPTATYPIQWIHVLTACAVLDVHLPDCVAPFLDFFVPVKPRDAIRGAEVFVPPPGVARRLRDINPVKADAEPAVPAGEVFASHPLFFFIVYLTVLISPCAAVNPSSD